MSELNSLVMKILSPGKGILAADESTGTMTKRLDDVNVKSSQENRLKFRHTLFTSEKMRTGIGGVILYEETIKQEFNGQSIPDILKEFGSVPGIKVDTGAKNLAGSKNEKITEGLDGLRERLKDFYKLGARFTKWRGVYNISEGCPSNLAIKSNAHALARYASLVQESGMVPIVEPEVLMEGNHSEKTCFESTSKVLDECFRELILNKVDLSGIILKPNMILPGNMSKIELTSEEIAKLTIKCLKNSVPEQVPGITFLSGGQTEKGATENLNLINKLNSTNFIMSFSYGRALQQNALKYWSNNIEDVQGTQKVFNHRVEMCSLASTGNWDMSLEQN